jgi:hypothetical protein
VSGHRQIFIRQTRFEVRKDEPWLSVSDRIADALGIPRWSQIRTYLIDSAITKIGSEERAYKFYWVEGKQYWWENVQDPFFDMRREEGHEIRMIEGLGRVDTLAVPRSGGLEEVLAI